MPVRQQPRGQPAPAAPGGREAVGRFLVPARATAQPSTPPLSLSPPFSAPSVSRQLSHRLHLKDADRECADLSAVSAYPQLSECEFALDTLLENFPADPFPRESGAQQRRNLSYFLNIFSGAASESARFDDLSSSLRSGGKLGIFNSAALGASFLSQRVFDEIFLTLGR